jgi:prepilin-type N-terminal cleavage/methylation domain-containing protein
VKTVRPSSGFTLIELLAVIAIIAIITGLAVPALKNLGRSNILTSSSRQLLDDIGRARQLAVTHRTTVFMVFLGTNFWQVNSRFGTYASLAQRTLATNLCDRQLSGYNFITYGEVGDQPGVHDWHYLSSWQSMPEGSFIAVSKICQLGIPVAQHITPWEQDYNNGTPTPIACFTNMGVPFPINDTNLSATAYDATYVDLPYIAFDYTGRLASGLGGDGNYHDAYIPLTQGSVLPARDPQTKKLQMASPSILESPPGNTTNISYSIIHIDALTGRAQLEYHKVQ